MNTSDAFEPAPRQRPGVQRSARKSHQDGPGVPKPVTEYRKSTVGPGPLLAPGTRLGRYVIDTKLGSGGMGIVYAAFDRHLGRRVAIKLIRGHDERTRGLDRKRERLLREAQALARLDHPNIVSLYDCGTEDGMLYLAMELVDGQSLNQWLRERPRTWVEIVEVISQAADGLAAAHAAGLVHRDFKPSNILVGFDGRVRVLDFGLARAMPEYKSTNDGSARARSGPMSFDSLLNTRLTDVNLVLGTNGYMAPEQLMAQSVGPWSDQFALSVTLYEALYGKKPFPGRNAVEVAARFKEGLPRPPSGIRIPARLRRLLERGLCLDRDGRFRSVRALKRELDTIPRAGWSRLANSVVVVGTAWVAACSAVWLYHALDDRSEAPTECRAEIDAPVQTTSLP